MAKQKKHAKYLQKTNSDLSTPEIKLFHGDDVEDALAAGWEEPKGQRANGLPWNPEPELEGEDTAADMAAELEKSNAERQAKIDKQKAKDAPAEPAKHEPDQVPDMKVQIVEPPKKAGKK